MCSSDLRPQPGQRVCGARGPQPVPGVSHAGLQAQGEAGGGRRGPAPPPHLGAGVQAAGAPGVGGAGAAAGLSLGGAAEGAASAARSPPLPVAYLARSGSSRGYMVPAARAGGAAAAGASAGSRTRHCGAPGGGAAPAAEPRASAERPRAREPEAAKPRRLDFPGTRTGRRGDPARALRPRLPRPAAAAPPASSPTPIALAPPRGAGRRREARFRAPGAAQCPERLPPPPPGWPRGPGTRPADLAMGSDSGRRDLRSARPRVGPPYGCRRAGPWSGNGPRSPSA